jgi:hypothetical protein
MAVSLPVIPSADATRRISVGGLLPLPLRAEGQNLPLTINGLCPKFLEEALRPSNSALETGPILAATLCTR